MTPLDVLDEKSGDMVSAYAAENEIAVVVRTNGNDVRVIAPNYNRTYLAQMLRIAAGMLEEPMSKQLD